MVKILSIKKRKGDIQVTFDNQLTMQVEYDIYVKYHLEPSLTMDDKLFKEMQEDNAFLFFKKIALKRLAKMMTAYELYTYLMEKEASKAVANQIVFDFKKKKYIDDDAYTKLYISSKQYLEGPRLIMDKLKQKGIHQETIRHHIKQIDEVACLKSSIAKKIKGTPSKNKRQLTDKLKRYYLQKGYNLSAVNETVEKAVSKVKIDEKLLLDKEIDKLVSKAKDQIDKQKLIEMLYRKGYHYDDIKVAVGRIKR